MKDSHVTDSFQQNFSYNLLGHTSRRIITNYLWRIICMTNQIVGKIHRKESAQKTHLVEISLYEITYPNNRTGILIQWSLQHSD